LSFEPQECSTPPFRIDFRRALSASRIIRTTFAEYAGILTGSGVVFFFGSGFSVFFFAALFVFSAGAGSVFAGGFGALFFGAVFFAAGFFAVAVFFAGGFAIASFVAGFFFVADFAGAAGVESESETFVAWLASIVVTSFRFGRFDSRRFALLRRIFDRAGLLSTAVDRRRYSRVARADFQDRAPELDDELVVDTGERERATSAEYVLDDRFFARRIAAGAGVVERRTAERPRLRGELRSEIDETEEPAVEPVDRLPDGEKSRRRHDSISIVVVCPVRFA
jgi:hypothetical protein